MEPLLYEGVLCYCKVMQVDPGEPTSVGVFSRIETPQKTYFLKRRDGSIFACNVKEADLMRDKYELVGVSDGTTFANVLRNSGFVPGQKYPIAEIRKVMTEALEAEKAAAMGNKETIPDTKVSASSEKVRRFVRGL